MTIPEKFFEHEGFRKLSNGAVALYFFMLSLEEKYGGAFFFSVDRFVSDLNTSRASFFRYRDELQKAGFIAIQSTTEQKNGEVRRKVKYYILQD